MMALMVGLIWLVEVNLRNWQSSEKLFEHAARVCPSATAHVNLGNALREQGRAPAAKREYEAALVLDPQHDSAMFNLGLLALERGASLEAVSYLQGVIAANGTAYQPYMGLAWILATDPDPAHRNSTQALDYACIAAKLHRDLDADPEMLDVLGVANAECGRFEAAIGLATRALRIAQYLGDGKKAHEIQVHLAAFRDSKPYHCEVLPPP